MFKRSSSQSSLFESQYQMSATKRRRLERSWAAEFRARCLPLIDEEIFRPLYCADNGAPCKSVRRLVAVLMLQAMFDLTDDETQYRVDFDLGWHLALGLDPCAEGDGVSARTLQYFRVRLAEHPVIETLFWDILEKLCKLLGIDLGAQRLDSTQIRSNFARRSRLGLFCETIRVLLRALTREKSARLADVPPSLRRRYLKDDGTHSSYDDARAADTRRRLDVAARDAYRVREALRGVVLPKDSTAAYAILERVVDEHCVVGETPHAAADGDADGELPPVPAAPRDAKTLTGAVLQTPHDPDVTYSGHKGQGYAVLLAETCAQDNPVQLITHVQVEAACRGDADRLLPALDALAAHGLTPETVLADTSFGSQENYEACAARGVDLLAPLPGQASAPPTDAPPAPADETPGFDVQVLPSEAPTRCPAGIEAEHTQLAQTPHGPVAVVHLPPGVCHKCPRRAGCPLLPGDGGRMRAVLEMRDALRADRRAFVATPAFHDAYRPRAGIEGTNSELKRGHGLGRLRVRTQPRVAIAVTFRVIACNIKRALTYWAHTRKNAEKTACTAAFTLENALKSFMRAWVRPYVVCQAAA